MKIFRIAIFAVFIASCGSKAPQQAPQAAVFNLFSNVLKDTVGVIRGAELGDEAAIIEQMEYDSALVVKNKYNLIYDYNFPGEKTLNIKYTFRDNLLQKIEMDVFLATEEQADSLAQEFKGYYSQRYGESNLQMGIYVWNTPSPHGNGTVSVIELRDESAEFGYGKLNITIYAKGFNTPA